MKKFEIYGYENSNEIVASVNCNSLDEASAWAKINLGNRGWSRIFEVCE